MKITILSFIATVFAFAAHAQELPTNDELLSRLDIPGYWEVQNFRIVAQAMVGTPIEPRAQLRFEVDASPLGDLYLPVESGSLGPFMTVIASVEDEAIRTLYGTMDITYAAGQWTGPANIENPLDALGQTQDSFTTPTLILGSERQKQIAEDLRSSSASDVRIALERDRQRLAEQLASEVEAMRASHLNVLSELRQNHEIAKRELEELQGDTSDGISKLQLQIEERFNDGKSRLAERLAAAETEFQAQLGALTGAHEVKLRELKVSLSKELGETAVAHLEELQKLETDHAKAVGTLIAEQEREMAEVTSKLETRKGSLEAQLAAADEVLALQASLATRQTAIRVNDESIKAAEQERQEQFGKSLDGLVGTWSGTGVCKLPDTPEQLYAISFLGEAVSGRSISGQINNVTTGNYPTRRPVAAQLHLTGNDLTMPLSLKATLNDNRNIGTTVLDLVLQADGWMVGQAPDGSCTEIRLSKS